jgi:checkpoint serine/threonine-protein kinase
VERIKTRHQAFLARILASSTSVIPDDEPAPSTSRSASQSRSALSALGSSTSTPAPASLSGAVQAAHTVKSTSKSNPNGAKMAILTDENGGGEDSAPGEWADFGTRDARRKENTVEATPWKGEVLPQKRVAPRTPKVEVFMDAVSTWGDNG